MGSEGEDTLNALLELLSSVICTAAVPEFFMEICCVAPVPIWTSPKSTDVGVATRGAAFEAAKVRELELQPESATLSIRARAAIVIVPAWKM